MLSESSLRPSRITVTPADSFRSRDEFSVIPFNKTLTVRFGSEAAIDGDIPNISFNPCEGQLSAKRRRPNLMCSLLTKRLKLIPLSQLFNTTTVPLNNQINSNVYDVSANRGVFLTHKHKFY